MNEMNSLEKQLHSWRPRRPSARLKRRLFGFSFAPGAPWIIGTLVPAAACAMLTLAIFGSPNGIHINTPMSGMIASNWNNAAFVVDGFSDKQNHWTSVTFDSTNRSGFGFTMGSFRH